MKKNYVKASRESYEEFRHFVTEQIEEFTAIAEKGGRDKEFYLPALILQMHLLLDISESLHILKMNAIIEVLEVLGEEE